MSDTGLPDPVAEAVETIRASTRALLEATARMDPDGIRDAVSRRERGIAALLDRVRAADVDGMTADQRASLREVWEAVDGEAREACAQLAGFVDRRDEVLARVRRGNRALRGYRTEPRGESGHLDRAG